MSSNKEEGYFFSSFTKLSKSVVHSSGWKILLSILKILAGLALLVFSLRNIQFARLLSGIRAADITWLLLALASILLGLGLKLWRWAILVKNYHIRASFSRLFGAYFVGQATNILLPFRGGELVRLGYFSEERQILPQAASTIVIEKYLDILALTVSSLLVSYTISLEDILNLRGFLLPVSVILTLLFLAAILFGPAFWSKLRQRSILPEWMVPWLERWVQASLWLRDRRQFIPLVLQTVLIWIVMWLTNWLLFQSLGLPLGGAAGGLVLVLVYIGLLPALMPGNLGPFYFFASLALLPFGVLQEQAVVFAVILHAIVTLPPLFGGAIGLFLRSPRPSSA